MSSLQNGSDVSGSPHAPHPAWHVKCNGGSVDEGRPAVADLSEIGSSRSFRSYGKSVRAAAAAEASVTVANKIMVLLAWLFVASRFAHVTSNRLRYRTWLHRAGLSLVGLTWIWHALRLARLVERSLVGTPRRRERCLRMHKPFSRPILVRIGASEIRPIGSAEEAAEFLVSEWPGVRDSWHRDAVDACLKVLEGYRSTVDAERAFLDVVQRAGIAADQSD
jgi:hypothetical protein